MRVEISKGSISCLFLLLDLVASTFNLGSMLSSYKIIDNSLIYWHYQLDNVGDCFVLTKPPSSKSRGFGQKLPAAQQHA